MWKHSYGVFSLLYLSFFSHATFADGPSLTIYNQNFAVVRESISLDLRSGENSIRYTNITAHLEPESVILRDPTGRGTLSILEQNYRSDPVSQNLLLSLYEGKTIEFLKNDEIVIGKIVRSGYVRHNAGIARFGRQYYERQMAFARGATGQPIIEVEGKLRFTLPGIPLFPALADDTILKPTLNWIIQAKRAGRVDAELSYITGGMVWAADYNIVAAEGEDKLDIVAWVTIDNQSGRTFDGARIKLMAGDVSKIQPRDSRNNTAASGGVNRFLMPGGTPVSEKTFDEYHLYTVHRPTTLHDRETKQIEFIRAANVAFTRVYVYDGAKIDQSRYRNWNYDSIRQNAGYGTESNDKIWAYIEFKNSESNNLGVPLPAGKLRFYREDGGQLEFTGENFIDHTPRDETVRAYTGNAFDLRGERKQVTFITDRGRRVSDETFEIILRNHKAEPVTIRVVEHLYRGRNWQIREESNLYKKLDSTSIEFRVQVEPDEAKTVTYSVHYTW